MSDWTDRLKSRKFLLAIFGVGFAILTEILQIQISPETWQTIVTLILSYIGVEGAADAITRFKEEKK